MELRAGEETRRTKMDRAHRLVAEAVRTGALKQEPCEHCGDPTTYAHHDDYNRPLDVRWLCRPEHTRQHNALNDARDPDPPLTLGPGISLRKLRQTIHQLTDPVLVYTSRGGEYILLGTWVPAGKEGP